MIGVLRSAALRLYLVGLAGALVTVLCLFSVFGVVLGAPETIKPPRAVEPKHYAVTLVWRSGFRIGKDTVLGDLNLANWKFNFTVGDKKSFVQLVGSDAVKKAVAAAADNAHSNRGEKGSLPRVTLHGRLTDNTVPPKDSTVTVFGVTLEDE